MGPLAEALRRHQLSMMEAEAATVHTIFGHAREGYFANSTPPIPMALWKPALGKLVGFAGFIEHTQYLARREGLLTPISHKISTTGCDPEKGGDEPLAIFDFLYEARRPPEGPLPLPL